MQTVTKLPVGIKLIIGFHLLNILLWTIGQGGAIIAYDTVAQWGLQAPRDLIDPTLVEINRGIGLADMIILIPIFIIAVIGLWQRKFYGAVASWLALGMTLYWPIVFLCSQYLFGRAAIKYVSTSFSTIVILSIILIFSIWAILYLMKNRKILN